MVFQATCNEFYAVAFFCNNKHGNKVPNNLIVASASANCGYCNENVQ